MDFCFIFYVVYFAWFEWWFEPSWNTIILFQNGNFHFLSRILSSIWWHIRKMAEGILVATGMKQLQLLFCKAKSEFLDLYDLNGNNGYMEHHYSGSLFQHNWAKTSICERQALIAKVQAGLANISWYINVWLTRFSCNIHVFWRALHSAQ